MHIPKNIIGMLINEPLLTTAGLIVFTCFSVTVRDVYHMQFRAFPEICW